MYFFLVNYACPKLELHFWVTRLSFSIWGVGGGQREERDVPLNLGHKGAINGGAIFNVVGKVNKNQLGMGKHLSLTGLLSSDLLLVPPVDHSQLEAQGNALMQVNLLSTEQGRKD